MIEPAHVQDLIGHWWFVYDQGDFEAMRSLITSDMQFLCRTDTGETDFEEFVRAYIRGRDEVMEWMVPHRHGSPYPLRHHGTNIHLTKRGDQEAEFASYIFVAQTVAMTPSPIPGGVVTGAVRVEDGELKIAQLAITLDTVESHTMSDAIGATS